ncbi:MAG: hypothetical protein J1E04_06700 [Alistipes sp.]|nr:hypothetical protein [Alistipes sp.]
MNDKQPFSVEISSGYNRLWRYNMAVTCGCFDDLGRGEDNPRTDFIAAEDTVAPVGANMNRCPDDYDSRRGISFVTSPCDYLLMYVYVVPHSLPSDTGMDRCKPFPLRIRVTQGDQVIHDEEHSVNGWSGASIELRLPKPAKDGE